MMDFRANQRRGRRRAVVALIVACATCVLSSCTGNAILIVATLAVSALLIPALVYGLWMQLPSILATSAGLELDGEIIPWGRVAAPDEWDMWGAWITITKAPERRRVFLVGSKEEIHALRLFRVKRVTHVKSEHRPRLAYR